MTYIRSGLMLFALFCCVAASAQEPSYDRVLLPVGLGGKVGANGSLWRTYAVVSNAGSTPAEVRGGDDFCGLPICAPPPPLPPGASILVHAASECGGRGGFISVERTRVADVRITLRSRDSSRSLESWGTSIPVVYPDALFAERFGITDIPVQEQFRATLRVLDVNSASPAPVQVRLYGITIPARRQDALPDTLLSEYTIVPVPPSPGFAPFCPGFAEIPLPRSSYGNPHHVLRVEITPTTQADRRYWAYVSVVDNVTHHLTILSPARQ